MCSTRTLLWERWRLRVRVRRQARTRKVNEEPAIEQTSPRTRRLQRNTRVDASRPRPEHQQHAAWPDHDRQRRGARDWASPRRNLKVLDGDWVDSHLRPRPEHPTHAAWPDIQHDRRGDDDIEHLQPKRWAREQHGPRTTTLEATTSEQPKSAGDQATTQRRHHRRHLERRHRRHHLRHLKRHRHRRPDMTTELTGSGYWLWTVP